ncbi:glycoside hydrolase family 45 protein [Dothidotthia symphoricarpi CBS 119687]|uniref:cellulase n=1 Tax=Dothidotthia symphoricarpi CBS 119687 TaxID=1392245 RepID=A0A6A6AIX1_9PLEO|nr:glycoside hydrolase family 45 protein [Dothidotthia symphoricarpi CBS 119687]KAF2130854.1 glycoside hydrolase family 45 protein [Dothidotthia symphoricarpi CBS 119687]
MLHSTLFLPLFALIAQCANLNYSGSALTGRHWDCCKPSCAWKGKADFTTPVLSCAADGHTPISDTAGTGCNGGDAFLCTAQQPWAVNDTVSYGFAGAFILPSVTGGGTEDVWCCSCYELMFTSAPLLGKRMIVQASNTAYDVKDQSRFALAIPGGNTTSYDACALQFGVNQAVFGTDKTGVSTKEDCQNLPEPLKSGCEWRFDWFKDAMDPSVTFKRVLCPTEITQITGCVRNDEKVLAGDVLSAAVFVHIPSIVVGLAAVVWGMLLV